MRRILAATREHGPRRTLILLARRVVAPARRLRRYSQEWAFDRTHGIKTRGLVRDVGNEHSVIYQPLTSETEFHAALSSVPSAGRTFIDLGCGRGRVLYLATRLNFRRVIGVEIDARLVRDARRNVPSAEVIHADVLEYTFPEPPLLIYLHNPFDGIVLRQVFERLPDGDVVVVYQAPWHREAVDGMFPILDEQRFHVVYDARR